MSARRRSPHADEAERLAAAAARTKEERKDD